jgi:hypothetical protein
MFSSRGVETIASAAAFNLGSIIATFAIYGCQSKRILTTAQNADFAESVVEKISPIATIAECA